MIADRKFYKFFFLIEKIPSHLLLQIEKGPEKSGPYVLFSLIIYLFSTNHSAAGIGYLIYILFNHL